MLRTRFNAQGTHGEEGEGRKRCERRMLWFEVLRA